MPALNIDKWSDVHVNTSDVMLVLNQNRSKNRLLGLITDYHTSCRWKFITIKCALYQKNATLHFYSEAAGVRRRHYTNPPVHDELAQRPEWNMIWLYVRSAACDVAHNSPQMKRSTRLTTAITQYTYLDNRQSLQVLEYTTPEHLPTRFPHGLVR